MLVRARQHASRHYKSPRVSTARRQVSGIPDPTMLVIKRPAHLPPRCKQNLSDLFRNLDFQSGHSYDESLQPIWSRLAAIAALDRCRVSRLEVRFDGDSSRRPIRAGEYDHAWPVDEPRPSQCIRVFLASQRDSPYLDYKTVRHGSRKIQSKRPKSFGHSPFHLRSVQRCRWSMTMTAPRAGRC
jgi:hypothetical protein